MRDLLIAFEGPNKRRVPMLWYLPKDSSWENGLLEGIQEAVLIVTNELVVPPPPPHPAGVGNQRSGSWPGGADSRYIDIDNCIFQPGRNGNRAETFIKKDFMISSRPQGIHAPVSQLSRSR